MSSFRTTCVTLTLCLALPLAAFAQRAPAEGMWAVGADVGFFAPDDEFDGALIVGGFAEFYPGARLGIRPSFSFTSPEFDRDPNANLKQYRLGVDAIYNWEHRQWHPFAGAGLGVHFLTLEDARGEIEDDTELGFGLLGGIEYFATNRTSFKFEGRYQWVDDILGSDPGGFALTIGVKRYF